jgi:Ca2+-binding EF-hand superfamily protein
VDKFKITNNYVLRALDEAFYDDVFRTVGEGKLMLVELIVKASKYRSSHTEEDFLSMFKVLNKDRTPNVKGRKFLLEMLYVGSNKKSEFANLTTQYRN